MSEVTEKDHAKLISIINKKLENWGNPETVGYTRVYLKNVGAGLLEFYKQNRDAIHAQVVFIESATDESGAAYARNHNGFLCHTVLVFSTSHPVSTYFSGTADLIELPKALVTRVEKACRTTSAY